MIFHLVTKNVFPILQISFSFLTGKGVHLAEHEELFPIMKNHKCIYFEKDNIIRKYIDQAWISFEKKKQIIIIWGHNKDLQASTTNENKSNNNLREEKHFGNSEYQETAQQSGLTPDVFLDANRVRKKKTWTW